MQFWRSRAAEAAMASSTLVIATGAFVAILGFAPDFPEMNFASGNTTAHVASRVPEPGTFGLAMNSKLQFTRRSAGPRAAAPASPSPRPTDLRGQAHRRHRANAS